MNAPDAIRLKKKALEALSEKAVSLLERCTICPRRCGVNRRKGEKGYCRAGFEPIVYSYAPHHGEEPVLSGTQGSGTIFFTHCNLKCVYCQNYYFSQLDAGESVSIEQLSDMMLLLQKKGCHNVNFVSPTHYVPQILLSLRIAYERGLRIPLVYNSGGYDLTNTLKLLRGIIDIYMPDMRYADDEKAKKYSDAVDYAKHNRAAVREMHEQVGDLAINESGVAQKGLIIRLLVLPEKISGAKKTLRFIADKISGATFLSLMSQYYPTYKSYNYRKISRGVSAAEYKEVVEEAGRLGLNNGWIQEGPLALNEKYFGPNIRPRRPVGE